MRQFIICRSISESSYLLPRYDDGDVNIKWTLAGLRESRKSSSLSSCHSLIAKQNVEIPPIHLEWMDTSPRRLSRLIISSV